jgi:hypothetical protein
MEKLKLMLPIILINCFVIIWVLSIYFGDEIDDFAGIFFIGILIFMICFNIYSIVLYKIFFGFEKPKTQILFCLLLIIPFILFFLFVH